MVTMTLACALLLGFEPPADPPAPQPTPAVEAEPESRTREPFRTEVEVGRDRGDGLAAQRRASQRNVGFVTAIELDALPTRPQSDELASVVSRAPGVNVRSLGGLGQFSSISIRGSSSQQVPVYVDGAPLSGSLSNTVDLSSQPLDTLERVEIYRGYVPVRFGAAAIGGALDLVGRVHRGPTRMWVSGGFGSYLAREARLGLGTSLRPGLSLALRAGYAGSRGDFPYFDDAGTPALSEDDGFRPRLNNNYDRVLAQLRFDLARPDRRLRLSEQLSAYWKRQGVPGPASNPSRSATQETLVARALTRARIDLSPRPERPAHAEWLVSLSLEDRVFQDREAELGLSADDEHALTLDGWLSPRLRAPLWPMAWVELVAELRGERVAIDERVLDEVPEQNTNPNSGDATRTRLSLGVGAELEQWLLARRWALVAGVRLDVARSAFAVLPGEGEPDDEGRDQLTLGFTPRAGTKIHIVEGLDLRASGGRYLRVPTLFELFGDRGYTVGNEGLRPEQGTKVDGGLTLDRRELGGRPLSIFAEIAGHATWTRDLIQWVRSGPVVRPVNVRGARIAGLELGASVRAFGRDLSLDLAYTFLDSRNLSPEAEQRDKPLPGRPAHTLLVRPSVGHRFELGPERSFSVEPRMFYELEWVAGTFLDLSGRVELPPRLLHAAGVSVRLADRVELRVEGRNLSNQLVARIDPQFGPPGPYSAPVSDFIGFPLPGISVWSSIRIDILPKPGASTEREP